MRSGALPWNGRLSSEIKKIAPAADKNLGAGDDTFTNFQKIGKKIVSGTVLGLIELGDGNDAAKR